MVTQNKLYEFVNIGDIQSIAIYGDVMYAEIFTTPTDVSHIISSVRLKLFKVGTLTGLKYTVTIDSLDTDGKPSTVLTTAVLDADQLGDAQSGEWVIIKFPNIYLLSNNTSYAIVVSLNGGDANNYIGWREAIKVSTSTITGILSSTDGGTTWGTEDTPDALMFEVWGVTMSQPPNESRDSRTYEDFRVKRHYSDENDVYDAIGQIPTSVQKISNMDADTVSGKINKFIKQADERIRRLMGIPITVRKEGHEFFNNPVVQLGPDREDPFEVFGDYDSTDKVEDIYAIYYNEYRTKIPYPKDWDQFTEPDALYNWAVSGGTMSADKEDFKCGEGSLKSVMTGAGNIQYPASHNLHKRIYPWFYVGMYIKCSDSSANFTFRIVRSTGSYYYGTFNVSNSDSWEPILLNIRRFQFANAGREGAQPDFNWILTYTEYIEITVDKACTFWVDNFSFNDGFFASYPEGTICWCVDKETEVLTKAGWKLFKDLTYDDENATLNKDGYLEYQKPINIIEKDYNGKMYLWVTRYADFMVMPNHNLYISPFGRNRGKYQLRKANNLGLEKFSVKSDAKWIGKDIRWFYLDDKKIPMKEWLQFLGWYLSEGWTVNRDYLISIAQTNIEKTEEILSVVSSINYHCGLITAEDGSHEIRIYSKELFEYLKQFGNDSHNKFVPDFIKELTPELINEFLITYSKGDGTFRKSNPRVQSNCTGIQCIYTSSFRMANDLQELLLKAGYVGSIAIDKPRISIMKNGKIIRQGLMYRVNVRNHYKQAVLENKPELVDYNDKVYCVTVPNHIIYIRRNGIPSWTGNCMPEWYPMGRVSVTYAFDPFKNDIPEALQEASAKLAGVLALDWLIGFRQSKIAFDQMSDSLAESPDRETLENTRRRLENEAMEALATLGFRGYSGVG